MLTINTATNKLVNAETLDLGLIPAAVKIDFAVVDGDGKPVWCEGKRFSLAFAGDTHGIYKCDDATVSFRQVRVDSASDTMTVKVTMDGEEILDDSVSVTYTEGAEVNVQADWTETNAGADSYIKHKPSLATVATSGDYADLSNKPTIPAAQVQADFAQTDNTAVDYIKNKPDLSLKLDAPAVAGTAGQVLTKTATGEEWAAVPTELPAGGTAGQVLTKTASGEEWANAQGGGDVPDATDYLCFTAAQANSTVRFDRPNATGAYQYIELEFSTDKQNWTDYTLDGNTGATITLASINDLVWFRSKNDFIYNYGDSGDYCKFVMSGKLYASGNIMSLLNKDLTRRLSSYTFRGIFENCVSLLSAPKLPALNLGQSCYSEMFKGCTSLVVPPELPATVLADFCYDSMFEGCTSLVVPPVLPAKVLAEYCYSGMLKGCTSLTTSPLLLATTLKTGCYRYLFQGCTSLKYVKTTQTTWSNYNYIWFQDASASGVFECPSALDTSTRDASHVPAGWTIVRTDSPKSITSPTTASSAGTYEVSPNTASVPVVTVASALTLSATAIDSGSISYAEVVLDIDANATVTAGTNITLVDAPTAGKRNICVVRWSGGAAKLYVVAVEDLPSA